MQFRPLRFRPYCKSVTHISSVISSRVSLLIAKGNGKYESTACIYVHDWVNMQIVYYRYTLFTELQYCVFCVYILSSVLNYLPYT